MKKWVLTLVFMLLICSSVSAQVVLPQCSLPYQCLCAAEKCSWEQKTFTSIAKFMEWLNSDGISAFEVVKWTTTQVTVLVPSVCSCIEKMCKDELGRCE